MTRTARRSLLSVLAGGLALVSLQTLHRPPEPLPPPPSESPFSLPAHQLPADLQSLAQTPKAPLASNSQGAPEEFQAWRAPAVALTPGAPAWEPQVQGVIARERDPVARTKALLKLLPTLPGEALAEVTELAIDQLPDRAFAETAGSIVTHSDTPPQVLAVLFADLMERPDAITLPALLTIARSPEHPFAPHALDNLQLLLRHDHGQNWSAWERAVAHRLSPP